MIESLVEPPNCCLVHYGRKEILACIQVMEVEYDVPMAYVDPGPAIPGAAPTSDPDKPRREGITVVGPAQPLKGKITPSLMADSYGFRGEEDWIRVQKYLKAHGGWQLEQVGVTDGSDRSLAIDSGHLPY